jgi:hypothetical protein
MSKKSNARRLLDVLSETSSEKSQVYLLNGLSGVGKSALMSSLKSLSNNFYYLSIDSFGERVNDKWIVDTEAIEDFISKHRSMSIVMEGNSDNIRSLANSVGIDVVIYLVPEASLFRDINRAKYEDTDSGDAPEAWRDHWSKMSEISDGKFDKLIKSKTELASRLECTSFVPFEVYKEGIVGRGWH